MHHSVPMYPPLSPSKGILASFVLIMNGNVPSSLIFNYWTFEKFVMHLWNLDQFVHSPIFLAYYNTKRQINQQEILFLFIYNKNGELLAKSLVYLQVKKFQLMVIV